MDVARIMSQPLAIEVASTESPQDAGASPEASAEPAPQAGAPPAAADQDADADEPGRSGSVPGGGDGERRLRGPLGRRRRGRGERPPREPAAAETREPESALPLADGENLSVAPMPEQPLPRELLERGRRAAH